MIVALPIVVVSILIGIDQWTKYLALTNLKPVGSMPFLDGLLNLTFVENRGVAFGMFSGQRWLILAFTAIISIGIVIYYFKMPKTREFTWVRGCLLLVFSGAIGNIIDRTTRGYVVDFFDFAFIDFPVFNMADIYVVVGVSILMVLILFVIKDPDEQKPNKAELEEKENGE